MGKFDGVLLVSDFDNTLVSVETGYPARNAAALDYFIREGGRFTLGTGRGHGPVSLLVPQYPINAPVIETNGTRIYDYQRGELLYAAALDPFILPLSQELLDRYPKLCVEVFNDEGIFAQRPNEGTRYHSEHIHLPIPERDMAEVPFPWYKILLLADHDYLLPIQQELLAAYGDRLEVLFSVPMLLEIFPKGCSKGAALLKLAELLGIDPADTYAVGDEENDIAMLRAAGDSFCCGDGGEAAKAAAGHVVCACRDGAIADVVAFLDRKY